MARINLLTIHYSLSPGAVLQTYAMCKSLVNLGHDVRIVNFKSSIARERRKSLSFWMISGHRVIAFNRFRKKYYPPMTKEMFTPDLSLMPPADYFLVGSDQVWNPSITGKNILTYMLDFVPNNIPRLSYASSFGVSEWDKSIENNDKMKEALTKFRAVSVRESSGVEICRSVFGVDAAHVLDPTLLLSDYSELIGKYRNREEIACFLFKQPGVMDIVELAGKDLGLRLTLLNLIPPRKGFDRYCLRSQYLIGWLKRIASAAFIITNSFHGLAFSVLFRKPFIVMTGDKKKVGRIMSLLDLLGLEDRLVLNVEDLKKRIDILKKPIDYSIVENRLTVERRKSLSFLTEHLR